MTNIVHTKHRRNHYAATITQRGQVTIQAAVRRLLGIRPHDRVLFQIENGAVRLSPEPFTIESAFGSVQPIHRPEDFEELTQTVMDAHVREALREMRDS